MVLCVGGGLPAQDSTSKAWREAISHIGGDDGEEEKEKRDHSFCNCYNVRCEDAKNEVEPHVSEGRPNHCHPEDVDPEQVR